MALSAITLVLGIPEALSEPVADITLYVELDPQHYNTLCFVYYRIGLKFVVPCAAPKLPFDCTSVLVYIGILTTLLWSVG